MEEEEEEEEEEDEEEEKKEEEEEDWIGCNFSRNINVMKVIPGRLFLVILFWSTEFFFIYTEQCCERRDCVCFYLFVFLCFDLRVISFVFFLS